MVGTSNSKDRSLRQVRRRKERHSLRERSGGQNPADLDGEFEVKLRKWIEYIEDQWLNTTLSGEQGVFLVIGDRDFYHVMYATSCDK